MAQIIIKDVNLGGLADSDYQGVEGSVKSLVGLDIHSTPGVIKVNQALVKESGATVDDLVKAIVPSSDGNTYLFGSTNGKIWKRTGAAVYSLEATASPASGGVGILDAKEFDGFIYYAMEDKVGQWQIGTAWSTRNDDWATFTNTDAEFHPMTIVNLILYIGDGNLVAQIEDDSGHAFTANALDVKIGLRIKSLGETQLNELLIGVFVAANVSQVFIFRWNTWSLSFSGEDKVPEVGVNAFLPTDNYNLVSAGTKGNLYRFQDDALIKDIRIPGDYTLGNRAVIHPNAVANLNSMPLFGLSNDNNNPTLQGVYSFASYDRNRPLVLALEYVISEAETSGLEIGAMAVVGDTLVVAWKRGVNHGVDRIDFSNKATGSYIDTRIMINEREIKKPWALIQIPYKSLPAGTSIQVKVSRNRDDDDFSGSALTVRNDEDRNMVYTEVAIGDANSLQVRVLPVPNGNDAPEIEQIIINV